MANRVSQTTRKNKKISLTSIVAQLLLFVAALAVLGILIIVVGAILIIAAVVGIILLILAGLLLGGLFLVFKGCSALLLQVLRIGKNSTAAAYAKATASSRYQNTIKPWLIATLKKFIRWLIPFLLWHLWQWASTTGASAPWSQSQHQPSYSLSG